MSPVISKKEEKSNNNIDGKDVQMEVAMVTSEERKVKTCTRTTFLGGGGSVCVLPVCWFVCSAFVCAIPAVNPMCSIAIRLF